MENRIATEPLKSYLELRRKKQGTVFEKIEDPKSSHRREQKIPFQKENLIFR